MLTKNEADFLDIVEWLASSKSLPDRAAAAMRRLLLQKPLPPEIKPPPLSPDKVQQLRETAAKFKAASEQITVVETWEVADLVLQAGKLFEQMVAFGLKAPTIEDWLALHKTALKSPLWPREAEQFRITVDRFNSTIASNIASLCDPKQKVVA